jgi:uncharacterized membrane protein
MHFITGSLTVAFLWATITLIDKHVLESLEAMTVLFIATLATIIFAGIYCLYHKESIVSDLKNVNVKLIFWICVTTFISVIAVKIIYLELLKHNNTAIVTALMYTSPAIVLILSMILFKEQLSLYSIIGILMIICGTILIGVSKK